MVKNLPAMQKTWFQSLDWEDPLEKGIAIHPSILVWRISWTEGPGGLLCPPGTCDLHGGHKELDTTERLNNSNV